MQMVGFLFGVAAKQRLIIDKRTLLKFTSSWPSVRSKSTDHSLATMSVPLPPARRPRVRTAADVSTLSTNGEGFS